ncbi:MAG: hypothetical protein WCG26_11385 [Chloroflexales bacterium]
MTSPAPQPPPNAANPRRHISRRVKLLGAFGILGLTIAPLVMPTHVTFLILKQAPRMLLGAFVILLIAKALTFVRNFRARPLRADTLMLLGALLFLSIATAFTFIFG